MAQPNSERMERMDVRQEGTGKRAITFVISADQDRESWWLFIPAGQQLEAVSCYQSKQLFWTGLGENQQRKEKCHKTYSTGRTLFKCVSKRFFSV
jgi:hypothetical protein